LSKIVCLKLNDQRHTIGD